MTADQRVIFAREFLAGARKRRVAELPPSVLMRELAECRRQLGQVLDAVAGQPSAPPGEPVTLSAADRLTVLAALGDAAEYRSNHPDDGDRRLIAAYCLLSRSLGGAS